MRWLCWRCQSAEVKPWTWPIEGGPPKRSSQPHHQLAVDRCEWSTSAWKSRAAWRIRDMASRFSLPLMPSVSNVMPAIRISTVAALRLEMQCCDDLRRIAAAHQAGEEGLGAGHPRGRDDVQHARVAGRVEVVDMERHANRRRETPSAIDRQADRRARYRYGLSVGSLYIFIWR